MCVGTADDAFISYQQFTFRRLTEILFLTVMQLLHAVYVAAALLGYLVLAERKRSLTVLYFFSHFRRLVKRIHITKRDLFYTDVKLFVDQAESDGVLDDVATMLGCTRSNLHVVASDKGLVVGRVQFEEDGGKPQRSHK